MRFDRDAERSYGVQILLVFSGRHVVCIIFSTQKRYVCELKSFGAKVVCCCVILLCEKLVHRGRKKTPNYSGLNFPCVFVRDHACEMERQRKTVGLISVLGETCRENKTGRPKRRRLDNI